MSAQNQRALAYAVVVIAGVHLLVFAYCTYWLTWHGGAQGEEATSRIIRLWILTWIVGASGLMWAQHLFTKTKKEQA